jgi:flagellin-like protein
MSGLSGGRLTGPGQRHSRLRRRFRAGRRGVSEVIATILILALTVTLFASIFAFVTTFPSPPAQSVDQFQSSLSYAVSKTGGLYCGATLLGSGTAGQICGLSILLSSGPVVLSNNHVYLTSQNLVSNWQFKAPAGMTVGTGIGNVSSGWLTGLSWTTTFSPTIAIPDNITVTIISSTTLLYKVQVSGASPNLPPVLTSSSIFPANPAVGNGFQIFAVVTGSTSGLTVNVTLSEIPGLTGVATMTYNASAGAYYYKVPAGKTTTDGTYFAFVRGLVSSGGAFPGATISGSVTVVIGTGGGGGGGGGGATTVTVGLTPTQPPVPQLSNPTFWLWATVTYPGTVSNVPVYVNFTVSQQEGGRATPHTATSNVPGQTGLTVSGPGSVTVFSATTYGGWLLNSFDTVTALAHLGITGSPPVQASASLATQDLVLGKIYATTSSAGAFPAIKTSFSHSCTTGVGGNCPYLFVAVWDNFTTAAGGPATISFSGTVTTNGTTGAGAACAPTACTHAYTIAATSVTQGSNTLVNVLGGTNRWLPVGSLAAGDKFTMSGWFTITSGATTLGYLYVTASLSLT